MAGKNSTNVAGLVDGIAEIARANAAAITAKGVAVEDVLNVSETQKTEALRLRGIQEKLIIDSENATKAYEDSCNQTYNSISSTCDLFAGAVGKTTPLGKRILAVRADWRKQGQSRGTVAPTAKSAKGTLPLADAAN